MTINSFLSIIVLSLILISYSGCEEDTSDIPLPFTDFPDISINLTLPEYQDLRTAGYIYIEGGVRGIIIYKESDTNYIAYERNCSFEPNSACATVDVHSSGFYMVDTCCGSNYNFPDAIPTTGPARSPLRIYETSLSGSTLTIRDESANGR
ncbi:hypothetical protein [Fulvivirga lutea]|uniref:Rieske domain-containing protein n=1 Tax=Fulvivirga lutea TaxID=2810512 RepID=A0A974WI85_9BACT|nr:hypothetical protein [Fulvivirga lutea]QSE98389.1 hypothetical protein JR347_04745 [Fulvivirga lutea]